MNNFLSQRSRGNESHSLATQLLFYDLAKVDSSKLVLVLGKLAQLNQRDLALCEKIAFELQTRADVPPLELGEVAQSLERLGLLQITLDKLVMSLETMALLGPPFDFAQCRRICQDLSKRSAIPTSSLVSIANSLSQINYFDTELCSHMAELMLEEERGGLAQTSLVELCAVLHCFANFNFKHTAWLQASTYELGLRDFAVLSEKEICQLLHSLARLKYRNRALSRHIVDDMLRRGLDKFTNKEIASALVSFASNKQRSRRFCDALAREFVSRKLAGAGQNGVSGLSFADFNSLVSALATLGVNDAALFRIFCDEVLARDLTVEDEVEDGALEILLKSLQVLVQVDLYESTKPPPPPPSSNKDEED